MAAQKLTLSIEPDVIDKAKQYAKQKHTSVSKLVQEYLLKISSAGQDIKNDPQIADWVKQLVLSDKPTPDFDHKAEYHKYIEEKYS